MQSQQPASIPRSLQELPPKWAHFCLGIENFIRNELEVELANKKLIIGYSGGIDSTALLLVLNYLSIRQKFSITAFHLDHGLRPESEADAEAAVSFCSSLGVTCHTYHKDVAAYAEQHKLGIEEAGRNLRYTLLKKECEKNQAQYIILGHHLDDLCEDVLMRMIRGSGWPALAGMAGVDVKRGLIRPFIVTAKETLQQFLLDLNIPWQDDASNTDPQWLRNRVRHTIMPLFTQENPSFADSIARMWRMGQLDEAYWQQQIDPNIGTQLSASLLASSHPAERLRLYKATLDALGPGQALADSLFKLDAAWRNQRFGATVQFPGDKTATVQRKGILFGFKH